MEKRNAIQTYIPAGIVRPEDLEQIAHIAKKYKILNDKDYIRATYPAHRGGRRRHQQYQGRTWSIRRRNVPARG
jgi:hypothetical protein